jgi:hypothetical protein
MREFEIFNWAVEKSTKHNGSCFAYLIAYDGN